jgi:hypothetical protein
MSTNQTAVHEIHQWADISEAYFKGSLILGNGASVAIHDDFLYKSLYKSACENELIDPSLRKVFQYHKTEDFELILRRLWHTYHVNQALEITDERTTLAYKNLRTALIKSVRSVHVEYELVCDSTLPAISEFLKRFEKVVSLNYDLLVYWAMMHGNEQLGNWFKDGFIHQNKAQKIGQFEHSWRKFGKPYGATGATLVFYPHGNLSLATDFDGVECKINKTHTHSSLLETVIDKWKSDQYVPLFVSEGLTEQKLKAISRSPYLQTVYDEVLTELGGNIAIYGWSISEQDIHILKALKRSEKPIHSMAISIHTETGNPQEKCDRIHKLIRQTFENDGKFVRMPRIDFFAASSENCWNKTRVMEQNGILDFPRKMFVDD